MISILKKSTTQINILLNLSSKIFFDFVVPKNPL